FNLLHLFMRLMDIEVPGQGDVAVEMQCAAVLDDPDIVQVNPVFAALAIQRLNHFLKEIPVAFIHDAGYGSANDFERHKEDDAGEEDRYYTVNPGDAGDIDKDQAQEYA